MSVIFLLRTNIATNEPTGIVEANYRADLRIYPNPTKGQLRIKNCELRITKYDVEVFDMLGKKQYAVISEETDEIIVNISHLLPGIYLAKMRESVRKVVKV